MESRSESQATRHEELQLSAGDRRPVPGPRAPLLPPPAESPTAVSKSRGPESISAPTSLQNVSWDFLSAKLQEARDSSRGPSSMSRYITKEDGGRDSRDEMAGGFLRRGDMGRGPSSVISEGSDTYTSLGYSSSTSGGFSHLKSTGGAIAWSNDYRENPRSDIRKTLLDQMLKQESGLEALLKYEKRPVVGLDLVIEYTGSRLYCCTLCDVTGSDHLIIEHVVSYEHRVRYIRLKMPSEARFYLLPNGKSINQNDGLRYKASFRCKDLELVYGRGEVVQKREKIPFSAEKLNAPEVDSITIDPKAKANEPNPFLLDVYRGVRKVEFKTKGDIRAARQIIDRLTDAITENMMKRRPY